jgi:membrane peptidoglycan carboxypeptidase
VLPLSWQAEFERPFSALAPQFDAPVVRLTVDFRLQQALQIIVSTDVARLAQTLPAGVRGQLDAGLVVLENQTGDVLAIIPSADQARVYSNATGARRDVASIMKTFTLAACLDSGHYSLNSVVDDTPIVHAELLSAPDYAPRDYDDRYLGRVPLITAFAHSRNAPFVRLGEECRLPLNSLLTSIELRQLKSWRSEYLGAYGATILSVAAAYASFANGGIFRQPRIVGGVRDSITGARIGIANSLHRAVSEQTAFDVLQAMRATVTEGTAIRLGEAGLPGGAKTGTSTGPRDLWFCYVERRFTMVVWLGRLDDGELWPGSSSASILPPLVIEAVGAVYQILGGD